jgi:UDP-3-O-[3-hydroxymyristoyl] glucosamine N-acyltransferase
MMFTAAQIAALINATIDGDENAAVTGFGKIEKATPNELAFLANPKYEEFLYTTQASIVIVEKNLQLTKPVTATLLRVPDAYGAFATLLDYYQNLQQQQLVGIEQPSFIAEGVKLGQQVYVGAFSYISKNVVIGNGVKIYPNVYIGQGVTIADNTILYAGVKIYHTCILGSNVIVHAGCVIGADGFGFAPQANGSLKKVPQIGNVVIEDNVEIGANATIDRATIGSTIIKSGVKLDNLLQVAHNVEVGSNTVIAAQTGISGSTKIGSNVMIGGQVGIAGHITIHDGVKIGAQSGVTKSVKANTKLMGSPAAEYSSAMRAQAVGRNLPALQNRITELEELVKSLLAKM